MLAVLFPFACWLASQSVAPASGRSEPVEDRTWSATAEGADALDAGRGWRLAVRGTGLTVRPLPGEASAPAETWSFEIGTASFGRAGASASVEPGRATARGNRVELAHGPLVEWFERGEHGVEHGWTIPAAPEGAEDARLWIGLRVAGDLTMHVTDDGSGAFLRDARGVLKLRYGYLKTYDATGAVLPSRMSASPRGMGIEIDAAGAAYPITVDPLLLPPVWSFETDQACVSGCGAGSRNWMMGRTAGDVNGDGFSDMIVGAHMYQGPAGVNEGRVWVFHGGPLGPSTAPDWYVDGGATSWQIGGAVSGLGDVNRDGYGDIGALSYGTPYLYVWLGSATGLGASGLTVASADFAYFGLLEEPWFIAPAGDLNGDGYDDFAVSAQTEDNGAIVDAGAVYVFFGSPTGPSATPWVQRGNQVGARFGVAASAGDVNADGYSDLVVGEPQQDITAVDQGRVHCFHGSPTFSTDHLADWFRDGDAGQGSNHGHSVIGGGDINGDGYADVLVGAPLLGNSAPSEGRTWVYLGGPGGLANAQGWLESGGANYYSGYDVGAAGDVDGDGYADFVIGSLTGAWFFHGSAQGFPGGAPFNGQLIPALASNQLGQFVGGAGDVNGDGFCDVTATAPRHSNGQTYEGLVQVAFGSPNPQPSQGGPLLEAGNLQSGTLQSRTGRSVSSAGDVNADGFNDVVVGSPEFGATDNGRAQVFLGGPDGLDLTTPFWTFDGTNSGEQLGWSVSAGDIDNDGKSDIVVGAPRYASGEADEGRVYLFKSSGTSIAAAPTWTFESNAVGALLGSAVSALGDVNGDGYADIAAGAPGALAGQGRVTLFHGRGTGLASITAAITITSGVAGSDFGTALALVGDVDLDGFGDLLVGAPGVDNPQADEGRVYVYLGTEQGIPSASDGQEESQQAGARLGSSVAACGDINGDGRAEMLVGAPGYDAASSGGAAFVYQAVPAGPNITFGVLALRNGAQAGSQYGFSVSAGGDVNGDGWNDVLVGSPDYTGPLAGQGRIDLYIGSSMGLATSPSEIYLGSLANMHLGESIALGGDVNGDGLSDPIGGVPSLNGDDGGVIPLTGGGNTAWRVSSSQRVVADAQALQILGRTNETNQFEINLGVQLAGGNTATAMGRESVALAWEVQPVGALLDGSGVQIQPPTSWSDSGSLSSGLRLSQDVGNLAAGQSFHWRARTVVRNPFYPHTRWTTIQLDGLQEKKLGLSRDCNGNGVADALDIQNATSFDCNSNTIPDECDIAAGTSLDCNLTGTPDECDLDLNDCNSNQIPDDCEADCNNNFVADECDITFGISLDTNGDLVPDECTRALMNVVLYCFGDGSGTACPCGNASAPGAQVGCLNSLALGGGRLREAGIARVVADNWTLYGDQMPNSSALYFQGTAQVGSGAGGVFGDGLRCATSSVIRLGTKQNAGNASQYPAGNDLDISVRGAIPGPGGRRYYQCWYRNAASFCTTFTYNLTNGVGVTWVP